MSLVTPIALAAMTGVGGPPWWVWPIVAVAVAVGLSSDAFVYRDARSRGLSGRQAAIWVAGCVLFWVVMFPLWFVMRDEYVNGKLPE